MDEWELYDLENDPREMRNEYENPDYEDIRNQLKKRLDELRFQYGDSDALTQEILESDLKRK